MGSFERSNGTWMHRFCQEIKEKYVLNGDHVHNWIDVKPTVVYTLFRVQMSPSGVLMTMHLALQLVSLWKSMIADAETLGDVMRINTLPVWKEVPRELIQGISAHGTVPMATAFLHHADLELVMAITFPGSSP